MNLFPTEHKCPACGKDFLARDPWGYTRCNKKYCSWHCLRKHDRRVKSERTVNRLGDRERKEVMLLLREGMKPKKIAELTGVTLQAILYYQKKVGA